MKVVDYLDACSQLPPRKIARILLAFKRADPDDADIWGTLTNRPQAQQAFISTLQDFILSKEGN